MTGYLHSFESLAAVDGEGVRSAVFLGGCPLRCIYCHNPDTWGRGGCTEITPEALVRKLVRYKPYYKGTGGVTFSGGEPLCQADFIRACIPLLKAAGIPYAVDTSGAAPLDDTVQEVLGEAQQVLLDLKFPDEESYRRYTGGSLGHTLRVLDLLEGLSTPTVVRTVIVPGINDSEDVLDRYLVYLRGRRSLMRYELLPFHTLGFHKYDSLRIDNPLAGTSALDPEVKDRLQTYVNAHLGLQ